MLLNERYMITNRLRSSKFGSCYEANDFKEKRKRYILHLLDKSDLLREIVDYISENYIEFLAIRHPNLINFYNFDIIHSVDNKNVEAETYYYISEAIDYPNIIPFEELKISEQLEVLNTVIKVLRFLHFRGISYPNLTSDSIIIERTESGLDVKLLDFPSAYIENLGVNEIPKDPNTPFYYYDLLNVVKILEEVLQSDEKLREQHIALLGELHSFISNNSARNIEADYLIYLLEQYELMHFDFDDVKYYTKNFFQQNHIERHEEKQQLLQHIDNKINAKNSAVNCVLVTGEDGVGKTTFLQKIARNYYIKGEIVIEISCKSDLTVRRFMQIILDTIINRMEVHYEIIERYGQELVKISPELSHRWHVLPSDELDVNNEEIRLYTRFIQFLKAVTNDTALILVIDDLDRIDSSIEDLIDNMHSDLTNNRIFMLLSSSKMGRFDRCITYHLEAFNSYDVEQYLLKYFGESEELASFIKIIIELSQGIAYRIRNLLEYYVSIGALYLNPHREWSIDWNEYKNDEILDKLELSYNRQIKLLSESARELLIILAHVHGVLELDKIKKIYGVDKEFETEICVLEEADLITLSTSYNKEYFSFCHRDIQTLALKLISVEETKAINLRFANFLRDIAMRDESTMRSHIHYLKAAESYNKAMLTAIKYSQHFRQNKQLRIADKYTHLALEYAKINNDSAQIVKLLKKIADYQLWHKNIKAARNYYNQLAEIAIENQMVLQYIESATMIIELDICSGNYHKMFERIQRLKSLAIEYNFVSAKFNINICLARYYISKNDSLALKAILTELRFLTPKINYPFYDGRYELVLALYAILKRNYAVAFEALHSAINILEKGNFAYVLSLCYYYLGKLQAKVLGEFSKAENSLNLGLSALIDNKISYNSNRIYSYISKIKNLQGEYSSALQYAYKAYDVAKNSGVPTAIADSLANLIEQEVSLGLFSNIVVHMQSLEYITSDSSLTLSFDMYNYINLVFSYYYTEILDFAKADEYLDRIDMEHEFIDPIFKFKYSIHKMKLRYYHSKEYQCFNLNFKEIDEIVKEAIYPSSKILLKKTLLNIIFDVMCFDEREYVEKIYAVYKGVDVKFNGTDIAVKEESIDLYLAKKLGGSDFNLSSSIQNLSAEDQWKVLLVMANNWAISGDYFKALRYYLDSVDIIKSQYAKLPAEQLQKYIEADFLKRNIYDCINILLAKIDDDFIINNEFSAENLFNIKHYDSTLVAEVFKKSVQQNWYERFGKAFVDNAHFISEIGTDKQENIKLLLLYVAQLLLADNCFIVFLDDFGRVSSSFSLIEDEYFNVERLVIEGNGNKTAIIDQNAKFSQQGAHEKVAIYSIEDSIKDEIESISDRRKNDYILHVSSKALIIANVNSRLNNFTEKALEKIDKVAPLFNLIIDNYLLYQSATIDSLTQVYLRPYIEVLLNKEIARCHSSDLPMAVLMMDVDLFKNINDHFGHQRGDLVLFEVAKIIKESVRDNDAVGRYGGEEFLVLLPTADADISMVIAERIRSNVERSTILKGMTLTISIGVSVFPTMGASATELISKADIALYQSKEMGRNRVTLYNKEAHKQSQRFDKSSGVISGDVALDINVFNTINHINDLIKKNVDKKEKYLSLLGYLLDLFQARDAALIVEKNHKTYVLQRKQRTLTEMAVSSDDYLCNNLTKAGYYILWDDTSETDETTAKPIWKSCLHCDIIKDGITTAIIKLRVPIYEREFDYKDYNLLSHISGILSAII